VYTSIPGRGASHCSGPALRLIPSTLTLGCQQPRFGAASKAHSSRGASGLAPVAVPPMPGDSRTVPPLSCGHWPYPLTPYRPQACGCRQFPGGCTHALGPADGGPFACPRDLGSDEAPCGASQAPAIPCCACWQHQETFVNTGWICGSCPPARFHAGFWGWGGMNPNSRPYRPVHSPSSTQPSRQQCRPVHVSNCLYALRLLLKRPFSCVLRICHTSARVFRVNSLHLRTADQHAANLY